MGTRVLSALVEPQQFADRLGQPFGVRVMDVTADRSALARMYAEFLPKRAAQGLPPESDYAIQRWLDHILVSGEHLLVLVNGELRGHVMLIPMADGRSTELANFLHQSIRRRGIGTAMNRLAVARARELGFGRVWLSVEPSNIAAIRSYQNAGFITLRHSMWAPELEMEVTFTESEL